MLLVSGGTGLIGAHLLLDLVKGGQQCRAIRRSSSDMSVIKKLFQRHFNSLKEFETIEWLEADLLDIEALRTAYKGVERVFHCAAMVSFFSNDSEIMKRINIQGTRNMVNLALEEGVVKFVFVSSTASIGNQVGNKAITEDDKWTNDAGNSNYGLSKYLAEIEVWRGMEEGLEVAIVNPSIVIGPGNWESSSPMIFSRINAGLKFFTPGGNAFVDVRDVVSIMIQLGLGPVSNERFLICSENLKFKEVFEMVSKALDKEPPQTEAKRWMANTARYFDNISSFFLGRKPFITKETVDNGFRDIEFSNEKVKRTLNFEFRPIEEAVNYTAAAFKEEHR